MHNKRFDTKIIVLLLISVILIIAMFYILKLQSKNDANISNSKNADIKIEELKSKETKISNLLKKNETLKNQDESFLDGLRSYIKLPQTDSDYDSFIGVVKNNYPFGNPIQEQKK